MCLFIHYIHCRLKSDFILRFADTAAILILPLGHPIINIEINCRQSNILILKIIMGCPGSKINMAAVSAKRSM